MTIEQRVMTADGASLWVAIEGDGPPVVLCHGGPGLWDYLGDLARLLSDRCTVYRWDQRACGRSSGGSDPPTMTRTLDDLEELRRHFGHERWSVVGHSWGAHVALLHGLLRAQGTRCVAYVSGTGPQGWWREHGRAEYRANRARRLSPDQQRRLAQLDERPVRSREEEVEFRTLSWMTDFIEPAATAALVEMAEAPHSINVDLNRSLTSETVLDDDALRAHMERSSVPMLFVHGAGDPRPPDGARLLAGWSPRSRWMLMPAAGHLPWVERPDELRAALLNFLDAPGFGGRV